MSGPVLEAKVFNLPYAVYTANAVPFGRSYFRALHFKEEHALQYAAGGSGGDGSESSDSENDATTEAHLTKAMFNENYYEILGLGEYGCSANDEQIRKAYRKLLLKYHPDKKSNSSTAASTTTSASTPPSSTSGESDALFLTIQKAYDTLSDETKRRAYDSQFDFDESIPSGNESSEFYSTYAPVFLRNARFSVRKPVPELGNDSTPIEKVFDFYKFWTEFDSWRDFSQFMEHKVDEAESRDEKRWMEKQNANANRKRKQAEIQRIQMLVERARARDPRIARYRNELKQQKDQAKAAKQAAKEEREAQRQRELEEARKREEARIEEEKKKVQEAKNAKKAEQKELAGERKRVRTALMRVPGKDVEAAGMSVEYLIGKLDLTSLRSLADSMDAESDDNKVFAVLKDAETAERAREEAKKKETAAALAADKQKAAVTTEAPWADDETSLLVKAVAKFPGGTRNRWETIATYINTTGKYIRTANECIAKARSIEEDRRIAISKQQSGAVPAHLLTVVPTPAPNPTTTATTTATTTTTTTTSASVTTKQPQQPPTAPKPTPTTTTTTTPASSTTTTTTTTKPKSTKPKTDATTTTPATTTTVTAPTTTSGDGDGDGDGDDGAADVWTSEEQAKLEAALAKYPSSMDKNERWKAIATAVGTKNKKQCVARFKVLREQILKTKGK